MFELPEEYIQELKSFSDSLAPPEKKRSLLSFKPGDHVVKIGMGKSKDFSYAEGIFQIIEIQTQRVYVKYLCQLTLFDLSEGDGEVKKMESRLLEDWVSVDDLNEPHKSQVLKLLSGEIKQSEK